MLILLDRMQQLLLQAVTKLSNVNYDIEPKKEKKIFT